MLRKFLGIAPEVMAQARSEARRLIARAEGEGEEVRDGDIVLRVIEEMILEHAEKTGSGDE